MSNKQFNPVSDNAEFTKLSHDLGGIKTEFLDLIEDYQYLKTRLFDTDNPITDGEIDWFAITDSRLNAIYSFIHDEFSKIQGSDNTVKIQLSIAGDKLISDLYEKIHDRRQLKIENDPVLQELYNEVRKAKIIIGRE
ncbi:hypothetical protein [Acinetobacter puyangensis]|uniref:hypothetical protein n=1 Tax=Acinetobacter puyangensis TaxID=1096779 RepID=UPI003A4D8F23